MILKNFLPYLSLDGIIKNSLASAAASPSGLRPRFAKPLSWVRIPEPPIFKKIYVTNRREFIRIENQEQAENISGVIFMFFLYHSCLFV